MYGLAWAMPINKHVGRDHVGSTTGRRTGTTQLAYTNLHKRYTKHKLYRGGKASTLIRNENFKLHV